MTTTVADQTRLSSALVVAVDLTGVVLPQYDEHPKVPLDLPALDALRNLGRGGAPDGAAIVELLRERGLLTSAPPAHTATEPAEPIPTATIDDTALLVLPNPVLLRVHNGWFEAVNHAADRRLALDSRELLALATFRLATDTASAWATHADQLEDAALSREEFDDVVRRAMGANLLVPFDPDKGDTDRQAHQAEQMRQGMRAKASVTAAFDQLEAAANEGAHDRVPVVGVHTYWSSAPAGLGIVLAHAREYDSGALREHFDFRPRLVWDEALLRAQAVGPGIYLFSNYVWSSEENLRLSALVKQLQPGSITVHGGPDTPKYRPDVERYFADQPHVDIAVHGEGEQTFAELLRALADTTLDDAPPDLSPLADVAGLSFHLGDRVVTTGDRERIADLDTIPSPILSGLFDGFIPAGPLGGVAIETNRGCPYGCTFCDWGSATLSRVRKFDLGRIYAELEWCARNHIQTVGIADANFGIFERDVEIAEKIAELKATYGYPKNIGNNYAKNTVKHLSKIIEIFTDAGIVAEGKMSMQSFDSETLAIVRRKNIKVEKYDELSVEFRRNRLPMSVDLMLGLPGSTPAAFKSDLQACVDRDVRALIHPTMLLPNSPMNAPDYREEHRIVARPGEYVQETSSYTRDEWHQMHRLGAGVWLFENFGILRQVASYVRAETGRREVDFYEALIEASAADPDSWPYTAVVLRVLPHAMVPPISWRFFLDEIRRWLVDVEGIADDDALETVLIVQHKLLPARDRTFPVEVPLPHDYVAWRKKLLEVRDDDHAAWPARLPALRTLGPGSIRIDDPHRICSTALDGALTAIVHESSWDFDSPVSRPRQRGLDDEVATLQSAGAT
jgi:radical SAM superfamily enzyme YgiQ (UPF0313 family)